MPVVGRMRIIAPQDVHILIYRTCKYVTLYGKRDFADAIKLRILRLDYPGIPGGLNAITRALIRGKQESEEMW